MTVSVSREYAGDDFRQVLNFAYIKTAREVVQKVLEEEHCPFEGEADLRLVSDEAIRALNKETRGIDRATDVLSFPMNEFVPPADFSKLHRGDPEAFDPENGLLILGDIVISVDHVREQARSYGHSAKREYAFLIAHSTLHLLGYDHMDEAEAKVMEEKQEHILQVLNITRDGGAK